ncbi:hypothetical protein GCWU000341_00340 [Oribacterium sp. oral taxon 078 str. F0262]|nr:hypothetical protein GCWU000341_00340 [Oribacterium sp. oral taxon 078 str. F0262]
MLKVPGEVQGKMRFARGFLIFLCQDFIIYAQSAADFRLSRLTGQIL